MADGVATGVATGVVTWVATGVATGVAAGVATVAATYSKDGIMGAGAITGSVGISGESCWKGSAAS